MKELQGAELRDELTKPLVPGTTEPVRQATLSWLKRCSLDEVTKFFWLLVAQIAPSPPGPLLSEKISLPTHGTGLMAFLQLIVQQHGALMFMTEGFGEKMRLFQKKMKQSHQVPTLQAIQKVESALEGDHISFFSWLFAQLSDPSVYLSGKRECTLCERFLFGVVWLQYLLPSLFSMRTSEEEWNVVIQSFWALLDET